MLGRQVHVDAQPLRLPRHLVEDPGALGLDLGRTELAPVTEQAGKQRRAVVGHSADSGKRYVEKRYVPGPPTPLDCHRFIGGVLCRFKRSGVCFPMGSAAKRYQRSLESSFAAAKSPGRSPCIDCFAGGWV
jgi:hypothetical protein